ncbi:MAG: MYXO-CTERM sorting domain-containing protein, partial [Myxococcaceae bacterium]
VGSAWVDAGKPLLTGMPQGCDVEFPQGEMVLNGYPLPLPAPAMPDAGVVDAGSVEADAGVSGGGETLTPIDDGAVGCGCGGSPVAALAPMLLLALIPLRMRRER